MTIIIIGCWLALVCLSFWWFQFRHYQALDQFFAEFQGQQLASLNIAPVQPKTALVVHIVDDDCGCSRFARPHITDLETRFDSNAEFISIDSQDDRALELQKIDIAATPSVAIWSQDGELAYFGR
jgi:hypothetical protein